MYKKNPQNKKIDSPEYSENKKHRDSRYSDEEYSYTDKEKNRNFQENNRNYGEQKSYDSRPQTPRNDSYNDRSRNDYPSARNNNGHGARFEDNRSQNRSSNGTNRSGSQYDSRDNRSDNRSENRYDNRNGNRYNNRDNHSDNRNGNHNFAHYDRNTNRSNDDRFDSRREANHPIRNDNHDSRYDNRNNQYNNRDNRSDNHYDSRYDNRYDNRDNRSGNQDTRDNRYDNRSDNRAPSRYHDRNNENRHSERDVRYETRPHGKRDISDNGYNRNHNDNTYSQKTYDERPCRDADNRRAYSEGNNERSYSERNNENRNYDERSYSDRSRDNRNESRNDRGRGDSRNRTDSRKSFGDKKDYGSNQRKFGKKTFKTKHVVYKSIAHGEGYADFLPMNRADMEARGWKELDILLISGDAYIDHPAFAAALLGRYLESHGFKVGIITQPDWRDPNVTQKIQEMGRPRLFAGVSAGAVDSMLAHYTAFRKKRHDDAYTPGGECGARPNRAVAVYTNLLRQAFPHLPVVSGGIESSLRRLSHYDFWTDALRKSIVADAKLDLVLYGMGEKAILEVANNLQEFHRRHPELRWDTEVIHKSKNKKPWQDALCHIAGSARLIKCADIVTLPQSTVILPSHNDIERDPKQLIEATLYSEKHMHHENHMLVQVVDNERAILIEKPATPLNEEEMDALYDLPYTRQAHPRYKGNIPAEKMMQTSMTCHRGCGGGCSFCSLALHQGRHISSRSEESLLQEAKKLASQKSFDGSISDVGGPSANMWQAQCALEEKGAKDKCQRDSCMTPKICPHFKIDQNEHLKLLHNIKKIRDVRHVRVASGVRFDLALTQKTALNEYAGEFTGGQLKVAPEHCSKEVLELMRKPQMDDFETFLEAFYGYCRKMGKEQYVVPYLLSAFPGCTDEHMRELAAWLQARHWKPQQVQCFVPTPGTVASAMFHAECDPKGNPIFVAKTDAQRLRQHGILMGTATHPND